jgi:hypothetical protein
MIEMVKNPMNCIKKFKNTLIVPWTLDAQNKWSEAKLEALQMN